MPGASPHKAVGRFLDTLKLALSCVEDTQVLVSPGGKTEVGPVHALKVRPIRLPRPGQASLSLNLALQYEILERPDERRDERYKLRTDRYQHHILDDHGGEIVLFHWHPSSGRDWPHIHVSQVAPDSPITRQTHVASGRVTIESILRFAISDLGVRPKRADWAEVLDQCEADFRRFRGW